MFADYLWLLWPARHPGILAGRRAEVIAARVRGIALVFAALTLAWIPLDAAFFGASHWQELAGARIGSALALLALAWSSGPGEMSTTQAHMRLAALFAIPAAFFVMTLEIFLAIPRDGVAIGVAAAYSFVPFVLAAGISAFPLTALEALMLAAFAFGVEAWALGARGRPLLVSDAMEAFWLLLLIAAVGMFSAMSQLRLLGALVSQAARDPLTQCLRRESGQQLLEAQFLLATRQSEPLCVLFADIDRFKAVNDRFGHDVGDQVLAEVAASLRAVLRESDQLVRWGGEEFLVVLPHAPGSEAVRLIERLRARGFGRMPDGRPVTLSIGVAEYRRDSLDSPAELVALADQRMYEAKRAGRDCYVDTSSGLASPILRSAPGAPEPAPAPATSAVSR